MTFFTTFVLVTFRQVIVETFLAVAALAVGVGVGVGLAAGATTTGSGAFCVSFAEMVGDEYVKPFAERLNQPFDSLMV